MIEYINVKIKDIGKVVTGKTPPTQDSENYGGEYLFISPNELHDGYNIQRAEKTITKRGMESIKSNTIDGTSVLVGCIGWDMGNVAMIHKKCATNQQINAITEFKEMYNPYYVYYWLKQKKEYLFSIASVTRTPILSKGTFEDIEIEMPCLERQTKVSDLLKIIDDKIENNKKINDNLEQMASTVFEYMFPNVGYGENTIGDTITPKRGKALLSKDAISGNIPVIAGGLEPATYHNIANTTPPVLTISGSGANAGFVNLWHIPVWSSDSSYIDSQMTPDVYFWYSLLKCRQQDIFDAQTGSAQPHIYPIHIAELSISDIDTDKINSFNSTVKPLFESIGRNKKEIKKMINIRDWLLPMLMNGQATIED